MGRVEELEELLKKATPGPWGKDAAGAFVEVKEEVPRGYLAIERPIENGTTSCYYEDTDLAVAAVNALPDLIELAKAAKRSKMWRHHQDCNPLRECRCGLFDLDAALARLDGDGK